MKTKVEYAPEKVETFGSTTVARRVPYSRVDCSGNEKTYVNEVIDSGWLTTASKAIELEQRISELLNVRHAIAVNSCTSGLHLALEAIGISSGDKVLVPSMTFTASAEVIRYLDADPILLDVDLDTRALTPEIVSRGLDENPEAKCLIVVHYGGRALEMLNDEGTGIYQICRNRGVKVIEDAAHALPARLGDQFVGTLGDIACFSFYANKTMTTGEGGMVTTNSCEYADRIRLMRLHGIDRDVWKRFTSNSVGWEYDVLAPGFKYNLPDICAAVGIAQLERLEEMRASRQRCAEVYYSLLGNIDELELPTPTFDFSAHAWHLFPVLLSEKAVVGRNELIDQLDARGVGTSVHYKPLHQLTYYKSKYDLSPENYPNAESIWQRTISLPIYNLLSSSDLKYVSDVLVECIKTGEK